MSLLLAWLNLRVMLMYCLVGPLVALLPLLMAFPPMGDTRSPSLLEIVLLAYGLLLPPFALIGALVSVLWRIPVVGRSRVLRILGAALAGAVVAHPFGHSVSVIFDGLPILEVIAAAVSGACAAIGMAWTAAWNFKVDRVSRPM
ncbi:hypothetical protein H9645_08000 [Luteimonas sp. Sa2BVA3]|uniref:Uncharacterized protein n=1 Tax=Luteimonas colneyensis TaxID=2762230 RepID=A0ABR8UIV7_9GAMM|nr:hypothetical protein [Luteimonas colneyensis]MBD7987970.1 hypothetical protein [Luteimonas colneyensis]